MKRANFKELTIILLSLSLVFIFGCSENSSINEPNDQITTSVEQSATADSDIDPLSLSKKKHDHTPNPKDLTVTKEIDGKKGGIISLKVSMDGKKGTKSEVKLRIPKNAFDGKKDISITLVPGSPVVQFGPPGMEFDKDLDLDVKLENFWFDKKDKLDFAYLDNLGNTIHAVKYQSVKFSRNKNFVHVKKAEIGHFSRYGFTR